VLRLTAAQDQGSPFSLRAKASSTSTTSPPTDPQIAMIAVTADTVDIDAGKLAAEKSSNPKVK
jgi:predicted outer membrane protein